MFNNVLHIKKGFIIDTETGYQEIMQQYGDTCYIVHNFNCDGQYLFASYLTDRDIKNKWHDMTGKCVDYIVFDS